MPRLSREDVIARIRARLLRLGYPRMRMLLLVLLTGGSGLLASYLMLRAGLASMPLRYGLALLIAYALFLLLVRAFIDHGSGNYDAPASSSNDHNIISTANTGDIAPAGARAATGGSGSRGSGSGWFDGAAGDDAVLPLLFVIAVVAVACASLWVIFSAPTLFAELALDGALSATLYRRLRGIEQRHWLGTALRHTIIPFAVTAVAVVGFATVAQYLRPEAHAIGDVFAPRAGTR